MPATTIVIPVFNAASTIAATLTSVLEQSDQDLEAIAVDDGSVDESLGILAEFARRDNRLPVIRQPHHNARAARNRGLDAASGSYILFFDADEIMHPQMIEAGVKVIQESGADICLFNWEFITGTGPMPNIEHG